VAGLRLMSTEETAEYITEAGVRTSARTLESWRRKGTGPGFVRIGGRVRYRPAAVRQWLVQDARSSAGTAA
jgi:hypothetical protein